MNTRKILRHADPARRLPPHELSAADDDLLRQILATQHPQATDVAPPRLRTGREWHPILVTAIVAILIAVGTVGVLRMTSGRAPAPAASSTASTSDRAVLESAVNESLRAVNGGREVDAGQPSMIWTPAQPGGRGQMIDLTGKTLFTGAACDGGGSIAIQISDNPTTVITCTGLTTIAPINLTKLLAHEKNGVSFDVVVTAGDPNYYVKQIAVPTSTPTTYHSK